MMKKLNMQPLVQMLWRYTKLAVKLRIEYMMHTKKGAETHSVLVRDIPGVQVSLPTPRLSSGLLIILRLFCLT